MLHVAVVLDAAPGVSETFLETLIENLRQAGFKVDVWVRRRAAAAPKDARIGRVRCLPSECRPKLLRLVHAVWLLARVTFRSPREALRVCRLFRSSEGRARTLFGRAYRVAPLLLARADAVYFAFGGLAARYQEYFELRRNGFFSLRGADIFMDPLHNAEYRDRLRSALWHAAGVHCVCRAALRQAEQLAGRPLPHAAVVHTALDPAFLAGAESLTPARNDQPRAIRVLSVGRLHWKKGLEHGVRAFRELLDRGVDAQWEIIGEGPHRPALEWAIRDEDLTANVFLRGAQGSSAVREALRRSDIFFHPSVSEGISNAVIEAMVFGLPVIATPVDGMPEAMQHGSQGLLVAPRDCRAMADALEHLAREPGQRRQIGQNARRRALASFTGLRQQQGFRALFVPTGAAT
jgi:colanic acid/amylovoran biosynthesis glycosyltransferase